MNQIGDLRLQELGGHFWYRFVISKHGQHRLMPEVPMSTVQGALDRR